MKLNGERAVSGIPERNETREEVFCRNLWRVVRHGVLHGLQDGHDGRAGARLAG